jgi:hypothetical protein
MSPGTDVLVVCTVSSGVGELIFTVGISPANADTESIEAKLIVARTRFILVFSLRFDDARVLTSDENRPTSQPSCKLERRGLIFPTV